MDGDMAGRGVTRPMAEEQHRSGGNSAEGDDGGHGAPYSEMRYQMLRQHHKHTLWIYWTLILLGVWTMLAPFSLGYLNEALWVEPSGGRGVWFSEETHTALRAQLMTWSDLISGALLLVFGWRSLQPDRPVSLWLACGVGAWMNAAPVFFWAPTAAAYLNGTLVGMLVIALTILIAGMPNMILYMRMGDPTPPDWSYNPSSWPQRWIMIVLGFLGLIASRYLAMVQLGYLDGVWDPFFGEGTRLVLNSSMSHSLPVSDGALGALAYTFEFLMGYMGAPTRWRTMPWMVTFFGILVIPLGLVHIFLVISQPVVVGYWCTFCLVAAAIMLPMIPLEADEVVAMFQHMIGANKRGENLWTVFWKGGAPEGCTPDERSPELMALPEQPASVFKASVWGMSIPWTLALSAVVGAGLMAMPAVLGLIKPVSAVFHLGGALVVVTSVVCMGEVLRMGRYLNVLLGLIIAVGPWVLGGAAITGQLVGTVAGGLVLALAFPRGPVRERYGRWDAYVR
jgi:uncharacterized membrane protein